MHELVAEVKRFLEARAITGPGIVACSGGPDSVALLRALHELKMPVTVAHINHQLRGEESDGDEAFVKELAATLDSPFVSTRITLPARGNLEAAARQARYGFLFSLEGSWIVTGHTLDDQTETVLHHIIRGTGLEGLHGILNSAKPTSQSPRQLLRPLLTLRRLDVIDYLNSLLQSYRVDSSNDDLSFTRNRLRHEVLPLIRSINPKFDVVLNILAQQAQMAWIHLVCDAVKLKLKVLLTRAGPLLILNRAEFKGAPEHLRRECLRSLWQNERWPIGDMTFDHWQRLANLVEGDYPGGIRLTLTERVVQLGPSGERGASAP